ncbi:MAG: NADPH:quinone reductase [Acidobacteriia bacterium]|nr:NADPH:quinone reductase [Terriglobia bacterium]
MKAIRVREFGAPEVLRMEEVPDPRPKRGEVLVRIRAVGVNPVDTYIRSGQYAINPPLPYTPGSDAGGDVEAVGEGVSSFRPGDRVYIYRSVSGAYAEKALCTEAQVHPLPKNVSYAQGAAIGVPYTTAYRALFHKVQARPGETLLVHGASGGVGVAAVQLARAAGMNITGTAGTGKGKELVAREGAHHVVDHNAPDAQEQLMKSTGGRGFDVILEMLANKNLAKDLAMLTKFGRVAVVGSRGAVEINPRDIMGRDGAIIGMTSFNISDPDLAAIHAALVAGLENGTLRPVIGQELPLQDAARAHQAVMEAGAYGKIVLVP